MRSNKKLLVLGGLVAIIVLSVAFTAPAPPQYKNLKVLPKDTDHETLGKVMHKFNNDLGVKCDFCHAPASDTSRHLDFASDQKPEKNVARSMMKMTLRINKKFFEVKNPMITDSTLSITCVTCHHGNPHPEGQ